MHYCTLILYLSSITYQQKLPHRVLKLEEKDAQKPRLSVCHKY